MEALALEKGFAPDLDAFTAERSGAPEWLARLRREGRERFERLGFPTPKLEDWKYTGVQPIVDVPWSLGEDPAASPDIGSVRIPDSVELVFVNGRFAASLSSLERLPEGLRVANLRQSAEGPADGPERFLGRIAADGNAFAALNTAFLDEGAYLEIAEGAVLETPIHVVFASAPSARPSVSYPRLLVVARPHSQATIVETHAGGGRAAFACAVTEIAVGPSAVIEHNLVGRDGDAALRVETVAVRQERASRFASRNFSLSGSLVRNDLRVLLAEEGAECELDGLFVGAGKRHIDNHTIIDHFSPHGVSRELYKGIMDGRSRGVFHGEILVRAGAQKTDAIQINKNLLLSREALVNSTPALQILADDVKCKHGSTTGQLDAAALFYLRSRGIGAEAARALLTYAFAADVARRIRVPAVRAAVEAELGVRLPDVESLRETLP